MDLFRCSFAEKDWCVIVALSPESAATIYANERLESYENPALTLADREISMVVNVWNDSKKEYCGWFKVHYQAIVIADCNRCSTPVWVTNKKKKQ